jgi:type II secretory pathway pseudopilin PulG
MPTSTAGKPRIPVSGKRQRGFTYAMVLVAIVIVGILAGVADIATSRVMQADRENELMFRGIAYRNAIQRYHAVAGRYPRTLDALLKDSRFAHRPYLRTLYPDPMADRAQGSSGGGIENGGWQLVRAADGGIAGVASRSKRAPLKKASFPPGFEGFDGAQSYAEWVFEYSPLPPGAARRAPGAAPAAANPI